MPLDKDGEVTLFIVEADYGRPERLPPAWHSVYGGRYVAEVPHDVRWLNSIKGIEREPFQEHSASGTACQTWGVHGSLDEGSAIDLCQILSAASPDVPFRVIRRRLTQETSIVYPNKAIGLVTLETDSDESPRVEPESAPEPPILTITVEGQQGQGKTELLRALDALGYGVIYEPPNQPLREEARTTERPDPFAVIRAADNWRLICDTVHQLDTRHSPDYDGPRMADGSVVGVVLRTLRAAVDPVVRTPPNVDSRLRPAAPVRALYARISDNVLDEDCWTVWLLLLDGTGVVAHVLELPAPKAAYGAPLDLDTRTTISVPCRCPVCRRGEKGVCCNGGVVEGAPSLFRPGVTLDQLLSWAAYDPTGQYPETYSQLSYSLQFEPQYAVRGGDDEPVAGE